MGYKLVIFDVDGTLTREDNSWKLIHEALDVYDKALMHRKMFIEKEISYQKWADLDVGLWKNVHVSQIEQILDDVPLNEGISETVTTLKNKKYKSLLLSSGISLLADKLKHKFGFDYSIANEVVTNDSGFLTGEVICNVAFNNKDEAVKGLLRDLNINFQECVAIGDNENDINLLKRVGLSIALNPKSNKVKEAAKVSLQSIDLRNILKYIP